MIPTSLAAGCIQSNLHSELDLARLPSTQLIQSVNAKVCTVQLLPYCAVLVETNTGTTTLTSCATLSVMT